MQKRAFCRKFKNIFDNTANVSNMEDIKFYKRLHLIRPLFLKAHFSLTIYLFNTLETHTLKTNYGNKHNDLMSPIF